jgi:hypothetical protein
LLRSDNAPILFDVGSIRVHNYDMTTPAEARKVVTSLILDCLTEIDLVKGLKLDGAIRSLDEGSLRIMQKFGSVEFFARPDISELEAEAKERLEKKHPPDKFGPEIYKGIARTKFWQLGGALFDEHADSIGRMLDREVIRCDVGDRGLRYAYHWTGFGGVILKKLGYRK